LIADYGFQDFLFDGMGIKAWNPKAGMVARFEVILPVIHPENGEESKDNG
jgi:hypothetical protein